MAEITFGLATPHSPMLSTPLDEWHHYVEKDRFLPMFLGEPLIDDDGTVREYDELEAKYAEKIADELTPDAFQAKFDACAAAMEQSARVLMDSGVDVVVVVGDDQKEMLHDDNMPAFAVYWGETMWNVPPDLATLPPALAVGAWGWYDEKPTEYPGNASLGRHLVEALNADNFDVAHMKEQREGVSMAHAFTFYQRRMMPDRVIPLVPVFVNTFYPPSQPSVQRCLDFGRALRRAVEAWPENAKVGIVASGGLSHFMVHEQLDRGVLRALETRDEKALLSIPDALLESGNSEIKNWMVAATACDHLEFRTIEYVPLRRSPAGTGAGMGFGYWT